MCALILLINNDGLQAEEINVSCAPNTERYQCFLETQLHLAPGDSFIFVDVDSRQSEIREFVTNYHSRMPFLPKGIFETFPNLETLRMANDIKQLHHSDFEYAHSLFNLSLGYNKLETISNSVFSLAKNLVELRLDGNELLILDNYAFNGLDKLYYLSLSKNRIITLRSHVFHGAPQLTDIRLDNNEIETIEDGAFDLPNLLFLYLGYNQIKQLPDNVFDKTHLLGLELCSNPLTHLGEPIYSLQYIVTLILSNTQVVDIDLKRFAKMKNLKDLVLDKHLNGGIYDGKVDLEAYKKMLQEK